ncbi:MAG: ATP-binding protein [Acidobacteria bacterium]|nr:ATP-binding protein [Acidobacteriota bacterium]
MKINRIEFKNFFQFKDIAIDLTYPKGHEKAGQPLEKICIIGQSGTGKTGLLRLIKWFISRDRRIGDDLNLAVPEGGKVSMDFVFNDLSFRLANDGVDLEYSSFGIAGKNNEESEKLSITDWEKLLLDEVKNINNLMINFPTELISQRSIRRKEEVLDLSPTMKEVQRIYRENLGEKPVTTLEEGIKRSKQNAFRDKLKPGQIIDFAIEDVEKTWHLVLKEMREYRGQELFLKGKISDILKQEPGNVFKLQKAQDELEQWKTRPNPFDALADDCLDPLLEKLELRVKRDIDLESILNLGFVQLQTLEGIDVPIENWSTGTWQIVRTMAPLFVLKPSGAVILMDEPERSLYPDIQTTIIDSYVEYAKGSQLFFATHSPLTASCFEPWEIIELKYDHESHSVFQELQYKGENHVDNYENYPEYLRWDSILLDIFDLEQDGNKKRTDALVELTKLKVKIIRLKENNQLNSKEGEEVKKRYLELNRLLGWRNGSDE